MGLLTLQTLAGPRADREEMTFTEEDRQSRLALDCERPEHLVEGVVAASEAN